MKRKIKRTFFSSWKVMFNSKSKKKKKKLSLRLNNERERVPHFSCKIWDFLPVWIMGWYFRKKVTCLNLKLIWGSKIEIKEREFECLVVDLRTYFDKIDVRFGTDQVKVKVEFWCWSTVREQRSMVVSDDLSNGCRILGFSIPKLLTKYRNY